MAVAEHPALTRLDVLLVARGYLPTRARARDAILRGTVFVDGTKARKPGLAVSPDARIHVGDPAATYVSRGALKLLHALDIFRFDPKGRVAVDLGASTGGFTEVLRKRGAAKVYAIDVGHDQLRQQLREDPGVIVREGVNARHLTTAHVPEPVQALTADVSFISLRLVLPSAMALCARNAWLVVLVKPQFELGRNAVNKAGVVMDRRAAGEVADTLALWIADQGWSLQGVAPSPITGTNGNSEYLVGAVKRG